MGDIVDGLLRAGHFDAAVGQEFNLASGAETRIIDLAEMINRQVGNQAGITFTERRKWDTKPRLLASVEQIAPWFRADLGRPSKEFYTVLGVLVPQQMHDLTDADTVNQLAFHEEWHYALNITEEGDAAKLKPGSQVPQGG